MPGADKTLNNSDLFSKHDAPESYSNIRIPVLFVLYDSETKAFLSQAGTESEHGGCPANTDQDIVRDMLNQAETIGMEDEL